MEPRATRRPTRIPQLASGPSLHAKPISFSTYDDVPIGLEFHERDKARAVGEGNCPV